jgi:hypothetical protein
MPLLHTWSVGQHFIQIGTYEGIERSAMLNPRLLQKAGFKKSCYASATIDLDQASERGLRRPIVATLGQVVCLYRLAYIPYKLGINIPKIGNSSAFEYP